MAKRIIIRKPTTSDVAANKAPTIAPPVYGPFPRTQTRAFVRCKKCESAVLPNFIQASGLCKICDARVLASKITSYERTGEASASRETLRPDFGHDDAPELAETGELDENGQPIVVDVNLDDELDIDLHVSKTAKGKALDQAADALLDGGLVSTAAQKLIRDEAIRRRNALIAAVLKAAETDERQARMNAARRKLFLEPRMFKTSFKLMTVAQFGALKKLGHSAADLSDAAMTAQEASELMQRGPTWRW